MHTHTHSFQIRLQTCNKRKTQEINNKQSAKVLNIVIKRLIAIKAITRCIKKIAKDNTFTRLYFFFYKRYQ